MNWRDVINMLNDDELGLILKWVDDPNDRKLASLVSKQWLRVEGHTRSSITVFKLDSLPRLLARFPNLVSFRTRKPITSSDQLKLVAKACPKLETFVLDIVGCKDLDVPSGGGLWRRVSKVRDEGLCAVANGCPKLSKIVLHTRRVGMVGFEALIASATHTLSHLGLSHNTWVSDQVLEVIGSSVCPISFLNSHGSADIADTRLAFLADGSSSNNYTLVLRKMG